MGCKAQLCGCNLCEQQVNFCDEMAEEDVMITVVTSALIIVALSYKNN